jgi:hypothetical protein
LNKNDKPKIDDEEIDEKLEKNELEELDPLIRTTYEPLLKNISEENLKKLFSKQILHREEGLENFISNINSILSDGTNLSVNLNLSMKMLLFQLSEGHPLIGIKSIQLFELLLNKISTMELNDMNYDFGITDNLLIKIKDKLGDVNVRVRKKTVELYNMMMTKNFCDYNNLIKELVASDEIDNKNENSLSLIGKPVKSKNLILGKLDIFSNVISDYESAIKEKRTEVNTFPFLKIINYICLNLTHPKSEVRISARRVIDQAYKKFGYKKIEFSLKKVDIKELEKIVETIPELQPYIKDENEKIRLLKNPNLNRNKSRSNSNVKSRSKSSDSRIGSPNKNSLKCNYCKSDKFKSKGEIDTHIERECLMYINCYKCKLNMLVKNLTTHQLEQCSYKDQYKQCMKCKEAVEISEYDVHSKEGKCNPNKGKTIGRCPFCHVDIVSGDRGLLSHFTSKETCIKHPRIKNLVKSKTINEKNKSKK